MLSDQGMDGLNGGLWIHPSWRGSTAAWFLQSPVTGDDPQEIRRIQWFRISNHSWDTDSLTSGYVIHIFKNIYIYTPYILLKTEIMRISSKIHAWTWGSICELKVCAVEAWLDIMVPIAKTFFREVPWKEKDKQGRFRNLNHLKLLPQKTVV